MKLVAKIVLHSLVGACVGAVFLWGSSYLLARLIFGSIPTTGMFANYDQGNINLGFLAGAIVGLERATSNGPLWLRGIWKALCQWLAITLSVLPPLFTIIVCVQVARGDLKLYKTVPQPAWGTAVALALPPFCFGLLLAGLLYRDMVYGREKEIWHNLSDSLRAILLPRPTDTVHELKILSSLSPEEFRIRCSQFLPIKWSPKFVLSTLSGDKTPLVKIYSSRIDLASRGNKPTVFSGQYAPAEFGTQIQISARTHKITKIQGGAICGCLTLFTPIFILSALSFFQGVIGLAIVTLMWMVLVVGTRFQIVRIRHQEQLIGAFFRNQLSATQIEFVPRKLWWPWF